MRSSQNFPSYFTQDDDDKSKYYNHHIKLRHNPYEKLISGDMKKPIELPFRRDETYLIKQALEGGMSADQIIAKIKEQDEKLQQIYLKDQESLRSGQKNYLQNISSNINFNVTENSNNLININSNIPSLKNSENILNNPQKKKKDVKEITEKNKGDAKNFMRKTFSKIDELTDPRQSTKQVTSKNKMKKSTSKSKAKATRRVSNSPIPIKKNNHIKEEDENDDEENCLEDIHTPNTCYNTQAIRSRQFNDFIKEQFLKAKSLPAQTQIVTINSNAVPKEKIKLDNYMLFKARINSQTNEILLFTEDFNLEVGKTYNLNLQIIGTNEENMECYIVIKEGGVRN